MTIEQETKNLSNIEPKEDSKAVQNFPPQNIQENVAKIENEDSKVNHATPKRSLKKQTPQSIKAPPNPTVEKFFTLT